MLTLRTIGIRDYSVREAGQAIGRIRYATERVPGDIDPSTPYQIYNGMTFN